MSKLPLGQAIESYRLKRRLSLSALAWQWGISRWSLRLWIDDKQVPHSHNLSFLMQELKEEFETLGYSLTNNWDPVKHEYRIEVVPSRWSLRLWIRTASKIPP